MRDERRAGTVSQVVEGRGKDPTSQEDEDQLRWRAAAGFQGLGVACALRPCTDQGFHGRGPPPRTRTIESRSTRTTCCRESVRGRLSGLAAYRFIEQGVSMARALSIDVFNGGYKA